MLQTGQYVRCPLILEDCDNKYPRVFVLGKITKINELSEEASVMLFDLKDSRRFFEHVFEKKDGKTCLLLTEAEDNGLILDYYSEIYVESKVASFDFKIRAIVLSKGRFFSKTTLFLL